MTEAASGASESHDMVDPTERIRALLGQIEDLEERLAGSGTGEVELTLLEQATELIEEAGRLLERVGHASG